MVNEKVSTDSIVKQATNEMQARLARKDNIAFYNVTKPIGNLKAELIRQDKEATIEIFDVMGVSAYDNDIINTKRVDKKDQKHKVHGEEMVVPRILIATFMDQGKNYEKCIQANGIRRWLF